MASRLENLKKEARRLKLLEAARDMAQAQDALTGDLPPDIPEPAGAPRTIGERVRQTAATMAQGATLGFADEANALLRSQLGEDYGKALAENRADIRQFQQLNPIMAPVAEIVGAFPTAMVPMGGVGRAGSLAGRMAKGAGAGAGVGGAYGFGAGQGGLRPRARRGLETALITGPVGAAIPGIGAAAGAATRALIRPSTGARAGVDPEMYDIMARTVQADEAAGGAVGRPGSRPEMMAADLGPSTASLLDAAMQTGGQPLTIATRNIQQRVDEAANTVNTVLDRTFGLPEGRRRLARDISRGTSAERQAAYTRAYESPVNYSSKAGRALDDTFSAIPDDIGLAAIRAANQMARMERAPNYRQIVAEVSDDGGITFVEMPNTRQIDYIKRSLQEMAQGETDDFGRFTGAGIRLNSLAGELRERLGQAIPAYDRAVKLGGDKIEQDNALRLGLTLLRPGVTREDVADGVRRVVSDDAREALLRGIRTEMDDRLANVRRTITDPNVEAREAAQVIKDLSSRAAREKVEIAVGNRAAGQLFDEIERAANAFDLRAAVSRNSATAPRQAIQGALAQRIQGGPVAQLRMGQPAGAGRALAQQMMGMTPRMQQQMSDDALAQISQSLTGLRGRQAQDFLDEMLRYGQQAPVRTRRAGGLAQTLAGAAAAPSIPLTARQ